MWKDLGGPGTSGVKQFPKFNTAPGAGSIRSGIVPGWLQAGITNPNLGGSGGGGGFLNWLSDYRMRKDEEEKAKENKWFHDLPGSELMQYQNPHTREMYTQDEYFPPEHPIWDIEQPAGGGGGGEDPFGVAKVDPWDWRNLETIIKAGENPDDYEVETSDASDWLDYIPGNPYSKNKIGQLPIDLDPFQGTVGFDKQFDLPFGGTGNIEADYDLNDQRFKTGIMGNWTWG